MSEGKTAVDVVQERMDAYYAWILGGCVGPDPCANLPNPPYTYGDIRLRKSK